MMGIVVEALDRATGHKVALKILRPEVIEIPHVAERLVREGRIVSQLTSEHVARVFDVGVTEAGLPYIAMELLEGHDLAEHLGRGRVFSQGEAVHLVRQACAGLEEAHAHGVVHRDLKPHNLFLTTRDDGSPRVTILDFGISKELDTAVELTLTQTSLGTPLYMSPEQVRSARDIDARSDVWSLGVVLFELITGRPPFDGETSHAVTASIVADPPVRLRELVADAPAELEQVILAALEKDRKKRLPSARALAEALLPFEEDPSEQTPLREHPTLIQALPRPLSAEITDSAVSSNEKTTLRAIVTQPAAAPRRDLAGEMTIPWTRPASSAPPGAMARPEPPTPKLDAPTPRLASNLPGRRISPTAQTVISSTGAGRNPGLSARALQLVALVTLVVVSLVSVLIYGGIQRRRRLADAASAAASASAAREAVLHTTDLAARAATDGGALPFEACLLGADDRLHAVGPDTPKIDPLDDVDALLRAAPPPRLSLDAPGAVASAGELVISPITPLFGDPSAAVPALIVSDEHLYLGMVGESAFEDVTGDDKRAALEELAEKAPAWVVVAEGAAPLERVRRALGLLARARGNVTFALPVGAEARRFGALPPATCPDHEKARPPSAVEWSSIRDAKRVAEEGCGKKSPWLAGRVARALVVPGAEPPGVACVEPDPWIDASGRACAADVAKKLSLALPRDKQGRSVVVDLGFPAAPVRALCGSP